MATTRLPPGRAMTTSALTAPSPMLSTVPARQLRADRRSPLSALITITQGALTRATADLPGASSRLFTLSRVTTATSSVPPVRVRVTSAFTAPSRTWLTVPGKTLRALTFIGYRS